MKINHKILSIPPYISTSWKNIQTLFLKETFLIITLNNGTEIAIPGLPMPILNEIFQAHTLFLEKEKEVTLKPQTASISSFSFGLPLPAIDSFTHIMHHNPEEAHAADLPKEILEKVAEITQSIGLNVNQEELFPKAEPHCNCPYCQLARTLHKQEEDEVELHFREWEVTDLGDERFILKNPKNPQEHYEVSLSAPVGCTCGKQNCEHIHFILRN